MYTLYYDYMTAAMAPHSVLAEIEVPYELVHVPLDRSRPAGYTARQPLGRVPVLGYDGVTVFESAAIVMHLCDLHPGAGLAPVPGTALRAHWYQWLVFYPANLHAATKPFNYPERFTADPACAGSVRDKGRETSQRLFALLDARMGDGPWVLGERFSACDHALHMFCTWIEQGMGDMARLSTYPNLARFVERARRHSPGIRAMLAHHLDGGPENQDLR